MSQPPQLPPGHGNRLSEFREIAWWGFAWRISTRGAGARKPRHPARSMLARVGERTPNKQVKMATIYREIAISADASQVWDALRDFGAVH